MLVAVMTRRVGTRPGEESSFALALRPTPPATPCPAGEAAADATDGTAGAAARTGSAVARSATAASESRRARAATRPAATRSGATESTLAIADALGGGGEG